MRGLAERNSQKFFVEISSVFVGFVISRDPSACTSVDHAYLGENVRAFFLLTFIDNVKKRRYLNIYSLEFNEICQNSCIELQPFKT